MHTIPGMGLCARLDRAAGASVARVEATPWARAAVEGRVSLASYATLVRGLTDVTVVVERGLGESPALAGLLRAGLVRRHALRRDLSLVGASSRAGARAARAWTERAQRIGASRRFLLVAHAWVLHVALPVARPEVVRGLARSVGLAPARGLEGLSVGEGRGGAARDAWTRCADELVAERATQDATVAEALITLGLLEGVLREIGVGAPQGAQGPIAHDETGAGPAPDGGGT